MIGRFAIALVAVAALQQSGGTPQPAARALSGVWEASRVNAKPLPMTDQVVGDDRLTHVIRLQGMTIRLAANGRFQAALKYRRAMLSKGEQVERVPLQNDTWIGTYTVSGTQLRFVPEKQGSQQVQPFDGTITGRRISVGFDYEIVTRKHYLLDLDRNDKVF